MNKTDLIAVASEQTGLSKKDTERVVNAALDAITAELSKGERVQLSGFGIFEVRTRTERTGRNPRTNEEIQIAASSAPAFKAAKALKDAVSK